MGTRLLNGMTAAAVLLAGWTVTADAQTKQEIAFVDMERVFGEFYKTAQADARLKEQAAAVNEERTAKLQELKAIQAELEAAVMEARDDALSEDAQRRRLRVAEEKQMELKELELEIRSFDKTRRDELESQGRRMRGRIVEEIQEVIDQMAEQRGLFAVVDRSGMSMNQVPVFLYVNAEIDLTDEIVATLNEGRSQTAESEPAATAP